MNYAKEYTLVRHAPSGTTYMMDADDFRLHEAPFAADYVVIAPVLTVSSYRFGGTHENGHKYRVAVAKDGKGGARYGVFADRSAFLLI